MCGQIFDLPSPAFLNSPLEFRRYSWRNNVACLYFLLVVDLLLARGARGSSELYQETTSRDIPIPVWISLLGQ